MNQHLIDWLLEQSAKEAWHANTWTGHPQESICRERSAMHIACANALLERRTQIELLNKDGGQRVNKQLHLEHIMKEKQTMNNDHKAAGRTTPGTQGTIARIPQEVVTNGKDSRDVTSNPLDKQVGGNHYRNMAIQPVEFIVANNIPYREANVIKYVCRHASKNGKQDLLKARHYIDMLIADYEDA